MKLSETLNDALSAQATHEYRNQQIYMQIATYFDTLQLKNLAKYFYDQSTHEKEHGDKFVKYINDRIGGRYFASQIPVIAEVESVDGATQEYVKVEQATTESIEAIYRLAMEELSFIDLPFLQSMLAEQVEEEDSADEFRTKIMNCRDVVLFDATFGG